jgi:hypothetical protein
MNKYNYYQFVIAFILLLCLSCIDIFEIDLSGKKVELIAPSDSLSTIEKSQKFWWNYMGGALWYELQVVSPNFSEVSGVRLDTILEINNFQLLLQPGVYHWRVRALNGSSSSDYAENMLSIVESPK